MTCGIYCIINIINNKKYVGKSRNIEKRWTIHKRKLSLKNHPNIHLLNAWYKYGENNFNFKIIEECFKESLSEKEIFYINYFDTLNNGYNKTRGGDGFSMNHSDNTKRKISESLKNQWKAGERKGKPFTQESKEKLKGKTPWNKGRKNCYTKDQIEKMSESKRGEKSPYYGKHLSEKTKEKISVSLKKIASNKEYREKLSKAFQEKKKKNSTSEYIGVSFNTQSKKWVSIFRGIYLGIYKSEIEAAKARDKYAIENKIICELNFPDNMIGGEYGK